MRELETEFDGLGYTFKQVVKTDYGYIYEVFGGSRPRWEVFKRVENTHYDCVSYPTAKAFGVWAKQVFSIERAYEVLEQYSHKNE